MMRNLLWVVVCLAAFAAPVRGAALHSTKSGNWSDATVWSTGSVPASGDAVTITTGHAVVLGVNPPQLAGVTVETGAALSFDPNISATLQSTASVVVRGTLAMKPSSSAIVHLLKFVNVNEAAFVGGGLEVVPGDVGLWVRDGQLDLAGTPKTSWTRLAGGITSGTSSVTLEASPVGWNVGDQISIVPTEAPSVGDRSWEDFDLRTLTAVSGATVTLNSGTTRAHPMVNSQWRAEVLNLTRNVRIEGTGNGNANAGGTNHRAHIWIRSDKPQKINYVAIRYMGPRKPGDDNPTQDILGRYGLHFHHSMDGSRGSIVRGTVIRDTGSHAFVSHMSHGVTFENSISYNTFDEAYWWDSGDESHDVVYDRCVAAIVRYDPAYRGYNLSGFELTQGLRNEIRDSVAVGVQGSIDASGFHWPEGNVNDNGVWNFSKGNIAHNNKVDGIFAWQNDTQPHVIANYTGYHNGETGIDHGAYGNGYHYESSILYGNGEVQLHLKAVSPGPNEETGHIVWLRFDNMILDGGGQTQAPDLLLSDDHNADGTGYSTKIRNTIFRNATNAVHFKEGERGTWLDLELCTILTTNDVVFDANAVPDNRVRKQCDAQAWDISLAGRVAISPFVQPYLDESKPQMSIVSPSGGSVVTGTVNVQSYAYDLSGVTSVALYVDDVFVGSSSSAPFTLSWNSASVANGRHDLQVLGTDGAGLTNVSARTSVFVQNVP